MERSRTAAHNRLSGLRGTVARRRNSFASRGERAATSPSTTRPHGVSVPMSIGRALAISDDPVDRLLLDERLSTSGEFEVEIVEDLAAGLAAVRQRHFDAIALDVSSAAGPNTATLGDLLDTAQESAIVVIGDSGDPVIGLKAVDAGAHEYVPRVQLGTDAVLKATRRAVARNGRRVELDRLANTDPLTGRSIAAASTNSADAHSKRPSGSAHHSRSCSSTSTASNRSTTDLGIATATTRCAKPHA